MEENEIASRVSSRGSVRGSQEKTPSFQAGKALEATEMTSQKEQGTRTISEATPFYPPKSHE